MIIKKGTKYYKVEKEMTKDEVDKHKATLQAHYDTLEDRTTERIKELEAQNKINQAKSKKELDELKAL